MRYSLFVVALAMIGAAMPQAAASDITCIALSPVANVCQHEVYFPSGVGSFEDDVSLLLGFTGLQIDFYLKLVNFPGGYDPIPTYSCVTAVPGGCDAAYADPPGTVYLLVAQVTADAGQWGWNWNMPTPPGVGPGPCGGPPAHPCPPY